MRAKERVPFQHLKKCEECGDPHLTITSRQKYPSQAGMDLLVIYRCRAGHRSTKRQTIIKAEGVPPKHLWEDYAS